MVRHLLPEKRTSGKWATPGMKPEIERRKERRCWLDCADRACRFRAALPVTGLLLDRLPPAAYREARADDFGWPSRSYDRASVGRIFAF